MQGQTSSELRDDGEHHRKKKGTGIVGVGASGAPSGNQMTNEREDPSQRGLEKDEAQSGRRSAKRSPGTTDLPPASAEEVAAERD